MPRVYDRYVNEMQAIADLNYANAVLAWDNEVNIPAKASGLRSRQMASLASLAHGKFTDSSFGALLRRLEKMKSISELERKNIEHSLKDYKKSKKLSKAFVFKKSLAVSKAFDHWLKAKKANDYKIFAPALQELIDLSREEAEIYGYKEHAYDAMLELYEADLTTAALEPLFSDVKRDLIEIVKQIKPTKKKTTKFIKQKYNKDDQWNFGLGVLDSMGYDFDYGRQDLSAHPFTTSFGAEDVRVTTRVDENDLAYMLWSTIHEGGHALYEQGLPTDQYGLPLGSYVSLGIHESQSRLWENHVGRSKVFWKYHYPKLQKVFKKQLKGISLKQFCRAINAVTPSAIRTESDELHYHFHIMIRYEIERDIFSGKLEAKDLKKVWNKKYKDYLGLTIKDDNQGILQDIHWSHGSFGYFPTYSLGSFYAAQFYHTATKKNNKIEKAISRGNCKPLLNWLRKNIHQHGKRYSAAELCFNITGEPLNFKYFKDYASQKWLK